MKRCVTVSLILFSAMAYGARDWRDWKYEDQETIRRLFASFRDSGFHFKALIIEIVKSPAFVEGSQVTQNKVESPRRQP